MRDIVTVLHARYANAHLVIRPARVQGDGAAADVARGLAAIARVPGVDVVIVGRGGGSIEDLWAFNEEVVARAIAACPVPVISAVGHETDFTIADFVADYRAPTPSAAAGAVVGRKDQVCAQVDRQAERLAAAMRARVLRQRGRVHVLTARPGFSGWPGRVAMRGRHVADLLQDLQRAVRGGVAHRRAGSISSTCGWSRATCGGGSPSHAPGWPPRTAGWTPRWSGAGMPPDRASGSLAAGLGSLSPLAVLGRGYAVCWDEERRTILRDATAVPAGTAIHVTLARGRAARARKRTCRR